MASEFGGGINLGKVSPADEAYKLFAGTIDTQQTTRDQAIRETMQGIYSLSEGFARAMVEADMPVLRATEVIRDGEPNSANKWEAPVIGKKSHPLWVVVSKQDLSGREMRRADIDKEVAHYSLLSHSYSGSHHEHRSLNPDKVDDLRLEHDETLRYHEHAIAVSALGNLVVLYMSFLDGTDSMIRDSARDRSYRVLSRAVQPSDLFDSEGRIVSKRLVDTMQGRLQAGAEDYRGKLNEERKQGPVFRDQSYYAVQELPIPVKKSSEAISKRRWRRS